MNDFRNFLETSRDFHRKISRHERTSAYYAFALTAGTTAVAGAGVYIAAEFEPVPGLITAGLGIYATKAMLGMGKNMLEWSRRNAETAEERQYQIDNYEELFGDSED